MEIVYHNNFKKKFKKLPGKVQKRFEERLEVFIKDKFNQILNNHAVERAFPNCRSINVTGDYRVIFQDQGDLVIFIAIGTHSELY